MRTLLTNPPGRGRRGTARGIATRLTVVALLACSLPACIGDPPQLRLEDYGARLARTLDSAPITPQETAAAKLPPVRQLKWQPPSTSVDLLDLWSMRDCALHGVIAQRNSSLGKLAQASTRMVHELNFLRLSPECIDTLYRAGEKALADQLRAVTRKKREQLPNIIWQAFLGGPEARAYWKIPARLADYPTQSTLKSDQAVAALASNARRWLAGDYGVNPGQVEALLHTLSFGDGGKLYKAAVLQQAYLARIDTLLHAKAASGKVCFSATDPRGRILQTVVEKYFVGRIQPWSVELQGRAYQLQGMRELEQILAPGEPVAYAAWRAERDRRVHAAMAAPRQHVHALLPLMRQCGLAPADNG